MFWILEFHIVTNDDVAVTASMASGSGASGGTGDWPREEKLPE
jgi:hypothetical protein